jgi:predicted  nucleic acid-binding Zn-ribbon protein
MWQKIVDFGKQLFSAMQKLQQHEEDIKELRQEINRLRQDMGELTHAVERLAFEIRHGRDQAEAERKILLLEIDNRFLRYERSLPPGGSPQNETER